jgi:hypothetical protein
MPTFSQEPLVLQDTHYSRKNIIYILKMKESNLCSCKCFMLCIFFNLQFRGFEIIKRPLNYLLMVILLATCRLQNPITTLMKSIPSWPQPLYTWTTAFRTWLYGYYRKVTIQGQSHNPDAWIPPKHCANIMQNEWLWRMEWLIKETIFKHPLMLWKDNFK